MHPVAASLQGGDDDDDNIEESVGSLHGQDDDDNDEWVSEPISENDEAADGTTLDESALDEMGDEDDHG